MDEKRRVLLYGGTFNPIHFGHLIMAQEAIESLLFDQVILIPSATPPHKKDVINFRHRHKMVKLATQDIDYFKVSDIEDQLDGPSYTINTVRHFQEELGKDTKVYWLIGDDTISELKKWHKIKELMQECNFVVAFRNVHKDNEMEKAGLWGLIHKEITDEGLIGDGIAASHFTLLGNPIVEMSSTDIRRRIREKREYATWFYMNEGVEEYINDNQLYQGKRQLSSL